VFFSEIADPGREEIHGVVRLDLRRSLAEVSANELHLSRYASLPGSFSRFLDVVRREVEHDNLKASLSERYGETPPTSAPVENSTARLHPKHLDHAVDFFFGITVSLADKIETDICGLVEALLA